MTDAKVCEHEWEPRHVEACFRCGQVRGLFADIAPPGDVEALRAENARLREALRGADLALEDWFVSHASDMADSERVCVAISRICHRGLLAYVANARAKIADALIAPKDAPMWTNGCAKTQSGKHSDNGSRCDYCGAERPRVAAPKDAP